MIRKTVVIGLSLLLFAGIAFSASYDIVPVKGSDTSAKIDKAGPTLTRSTDALGSTVFVLRRWVDASDYYLGSGAAEDTFATYLLPLAPCSLIYFQHEMYTAGNGTAFLWAPNADWLAAFPNGRAVSRTDQYLSPIGDVLFGPTPITVEGQGWMDFMAEGELTLLLGTADAGDDPPTGAAEWSDGFMAGWVKGGAVPNPLSDNVTARGFTYTWFGGPWTVDDSDVVQWGWYNVIIENMVDIGVTYPWGAPPIISGITQLPNTIDNAGTFTVEANVLDDDGWDAANESAYLHYAFYDYEALTDTTDTTIVTLADSVEMTQVATGSETFTADMDLSAAGIESGDWVTYWVSAADDQGGYNSTAESVKMFDIIELYSPNASILWIDNGLFTFTELNFYERGLIYNDDPADDVVEVYDAGANNGFDAALIDASAWDAIIYTAYGDGGQFFMPYRGAVAGSAFETYLAGTGDLLFIDQDYFFGNEASASNVSFSAGEFAYDVFGISTGASDPAADSLFEGEGSDAISAEFTTTPYELIQTVDSWADYFVTTGAASDWFFGFNDANTYGSITPTTGGGNSYYLAINPDLASSNYDSADASGNEQYWAFWTAVLTEFGVTTSAPEAGEGMPAVYSLNQNYPNPFNPSTQISFSVPTAGKVMVKVFNIQGQEVATLFNGNVAQGNKTLTFDASNLASGIYLYRMEADNFTATRKMVLVK